MAIMFRKEPPGNFEAESLNPVDVITQAAGENDSMTLGWIKRGKKQGKVKKFTA
jgi:hypothetical protein